MTRSQWTVARGPRVHEVARFLGFTSREVREDLEFRGVPLSSASSRVPVGVALDYCSRWVPECRYWEAS